MSKVITFSRNFPSYHKRKGEPTYFVEKLYASLGYDVSDEERNFNPRLSLDRFSPKHHTIRSGNRWKVGDKFSPRVWSGKPYQSKQQIIAPDITIKKIWDIETDINGMFILNGFYFDVTGGFFSENDGLNADDLLNWFPMGKIFKGQVICWNEHTNY